jgi:hypothetical protein
VKNVVAGKERRKALQAPWPIGHNYPKVGKQVKNLLHEGPPVYCGFTFEKSEIEWHYVLVSVVGHEAAQLASSGHPQVRAVH